MSFSYSSGVITQTGTDADPTGMAGLTGVTITGTSEYRVVQLDGVKLVVNGTLTLPKYYRIYFINTSTVEFTINGTVNVDYFTTTSTGTVYHTTPWIEFGRQSTSSAGEPCLEVTDSGTLNWRGGSILADPVIYLKGTALFNNSVIDSADNNMFRIYSSNLTFEGPLENIGKRTTINASGIALDNYAPKGGSGLDHGATNTAYVLNNFNPEANDRDSVLRFNNGNSIFNASTGMNLIVLPLSKGISSQNGGGCRLYRKVSTNIKDISKNPLQGVKTFLPSYDDGNRVNLTSSFGSGWDFTTITDTILTTASNGKSSTHNQILKVWYLLTTDGNDLEVIRFDKDADDGGLFTASSYKYGLLVQSNDYNLNGLNDFEINKTLLPNTNIAESNKTIVDAYAEIETSAKFYDRAASYLEDNFGTYLDFIVTRSGNQIDAGAYNVTIDATAASAFAVAGNTITIKASTYTGDMTTTGVITLANGAEFVGTRTDANGTIAPPSTVSITNITAGSRLQIYNVTTSTEVVNEVVSGTSYSATYVNGTGYTTGDTVRVRLTYTDNTPSAKLPYSAQAVVGSTGWSILAAQEDDTVYASLGVDGATVTEFAPDYPNVQVDINDPDGSTRVDRLYAWFVHTQSTQDGIANWFGGVVPEDDANFRVVTSVLDLKIDNVSASGVTFTDGRRLYRDDGASPLVGSTSGGGSITFFAGKVYTSVVTTADGVITGDIADLSSELSEIKRNQTLAQNSITILRKMVKK